MFLSKYGSRVRLSTTSWDDLTEEFNNALEALLKGRIVKCVFYFRRKFANLDSVGVTELHYRPVDGGVVALTLADGQVGTYKVESIDVVELFFL